MTRASQVATELEALGQPVRQRTSDGWQQVLAGPFKTGRRPRKRRPSSTRRDTPVPRSFPPRSNRRPPRAEELSYRIVRFDRVP
jgi:hypothetical protein